VAVFVLAAIVSVLLARQMTRPLLSLSRATERIAKGEFGTTVTVSTRDEIGELAGSFNRMGEELNAREKKLEEARMALVQSEKMAAFGQLGAGIAHEVKNPLAGILGYAQLALRKIKPDDTTVKNYLEIVEKETKRCKSIIENLLKFARQEKTVMDKVEVATLVDEAMKLVEHQLNMNGVKITKNVAAGVPPIFANSNQLQQVLMNLSINAQHAMEKGGMITISASKLNEKTVEIRVTDTGHGIPKEIMTKIFEPFFTTKPAGQGTGLGLSVTYGIIRDHKGTIAVESTVGVGTTFKMSLPIATADMRGEAPPPPAAQSQS
jgi:two-component system NtrC family sensor kinase